MKYCPNCLNEVSPSAYNKDPEWGGFGCEPCGILIYSNSVLLDSPDKEAQKKYRLGKLLGKLNINQETIDYTVTEIFEITNHKELNN